MWCFTEDVVAHWRCVGSLKMCWLTEDVVAHWRCCGSLKMSRLIEDVLAHWRAGYQTSETCTSYEIRGCKCTFSIRPYIVITIKKLYFRNKKM